MFYAGIFGSIQIDWQFLTALLSIVVIDLVLAGDNAVVIAMAVKNLPGRTRTLGIALGAGGAVLIRVIATFVVMTLAAGFKVLASNTQVRKGYYGSY